MRYSDKEIENKYQGHAPYLKDLMGMYGNELTADKLVIDFNDFKGHRDNENIEKLSFQFLDDLGMVFEMLDNKIPGKFSEFGFDKDKDNLIDLVTLERKVVRMPISVWREAYITGVSIFYNKLKDLKERYLLYPTYSIINLNTLKMNCHYIVKFLPDQSELESNGFKRIKEDLFFSLKHVCVRKDIRVPIEVRSRFEVIEGGVS